MPEQKIPTIKPNRRATGIAEAWLVRTLLLLSSDGSWLSCGRSCVAEYLLGSATPSGTAATSSQRGRWLGKVALHGRQDAPLLVLWVLRHEEHRPPRRGGCQW